MIFSWYQATLNGPVHLSACLSHFYHYVSLILSPWNFRDLLPLTKVMSIHKVKVRGQRSKSQRSKIFFFAIWKQFQFQFADGYEMKRIAVMSMKDVPYCFSMASVKFQSWSHGLKIDLDLIWARWQGRSQLSDPSDLPFLSLVVLKVVILTNFIAASDEHFVKMTTSSFQCWCSGPGVQEDWLALVGLVVSTTGWLSGAMGTRGLAAQGPVSYTHKKLACKHVIITLCISSPFKNCFLSICNILGVTIFLFNGILETKLTLNRRADLVSWPQHSLCNRPLRSAGSPRLCLSPPATARAWPRDGILSTPNSKGKVTFS